MAFPTNSTSGGTTAQTIAPNLAQHARGIGVMFEVEFFDDAPANTTPSVPANPSESPSWSIVDPTGVQVTNGVGLPGSAPGRWTANWSVPPDAPLSTVSDKWRIVWNMVTGTGRQLQTTNPFDVIELRTPDTLDAVRDGSYLAYQGTSERLILRLPRRPSELTVTGFASTSLGNPCPTDTPVWSGSLADSSITEVEEQNMFVYIFDTPVLTDVGETQIVWNHRQTITSPNEVIVQRLFIPPRVFWSLNPSLRVIIDKLQKKLGTIHAYTDSDIFEYFQRGVGILNGTTPATNWDLQTFPYSSVTVRFLIEAAALWALRAQGLLSSELQFSFSGQQVTLDQDTSSGYDNLESKVVEDLVGDRPGSWPRTKVDMLRQAGSIAHVGNRIMGRYANNFNYTFKVFTSNVGTLDGSIFDPNVLRQNGVNAGFTLVDVQQLFGLI